MDRGSLADALSSPGRRNQSPPDRLPGSSEAAAPLAFRCRSAGAGYSHQQFTERIIRALKERTAPWQSTEERARMKELEREVRELRRAK